MNTETDWEGIAAMWREAHKNLGDELKELWAMEMGNDALVMAITRIIERDWPE